MSSSLLVISLSGFLQPASGDSFYILPPFQYVVKNFFCEFFIPSQSKIGF